MLVLERSGEQAACAPCASGEVGFPPPPRQKEGREMEVRPGPLGEVLNSGGANEIFQKQQSSVRGDKETYFSSRQPLCYCV